MKPTPAWVRKLPTDRPPDVLPLAAVRVLRPCSDGYRRAREAFPQGLPLDATLLTDAHFNLDLVWAAHALTFRIEPGECTRLEQYIQYVNFLRDPRPSHGPDGAALTSALATAARAARSARRAYERACAQAVAHGTYDSAIAAAWDAISVAVNRALAEWLVALITGRWADVRAALIAYSTCRECYPQLCPRCGQMRPCCRGLCHACKEERGATHEASGDGSRRDGASDPYWRGQGLPTADGSVVSAVRVHNFVAHNILYAARADGIWAVDVPGGGGVQLRPAAGDDGGPAGWRDVPV